MEFSFGQRVGTSQLRFFLIVSSIPNIPGVVSCQSKSAYSRSNMLSAVPAVSAVQNAFSRFDLANNGALLVDNSITLIQHLSSQHASCHLPKLSMCRCVGFGRGRGPTTPRYPEGCRLPRGRGMITARAARLVGSMGSHRSARPDLGRGGAPGARACAQCTAHGARCRGQTRSAAAEAEWCSTTPRRDELLRMPPA